MTAKDKAQDRRDRAFTRGIAITSLVVGLITVGLTLRRDYKAEQKEKVSSKAADERFGKIETAMRMLTVAVAPGFYNAINDSLSQALAPTSVHVGQALNSAIVGIDQLQSAGVKPDPQSVSKLGSTLANFTVSHPDALNSWIASAKFITYKYPRQTGQNYGNCVERPYTVDKLPDSTKRLLPPSSVLGFQMGFNNCTLQIDDLDSLRESEAYKSYVRAKRDNGDKFYVLLLVNVHVIYRGGTLPDAAAIIFHDCTFDFANPSVIPNEPAKTMMRYLLASDGADTRVPLAGV